MFVKVALLHILQLLVTLSRCTFENLLMLNSHIILRIYIYLTNLIPGCCHNIFELLWKVLSQVGPLSCVICQLQKPSFP